MCYTAYRRRRPRRRICCSDVSRRISTSFTYDVPYVCSHVVPGVAINSCLIHECSNCCRCGCYVEVLVAIVGFMSRCCVDMVFEPLMIQQSGHATMVELPPHKAEARKPTSPPRRVSFSAITILLHQRRVGATNQSLNNSMARCRACNNAVDQGRPMTYRQSMAHHTNRVKACLSSPFCV